MLENIKKKYSDLTLDELYSILKLRNEIFIVEQKCYYNDIDNIDKESLHFFNKKDGEVISYLRIYRDKNHHIGRVLVDKNHRGNGVSTRLMQEAIDYIFKELKEVEIEIEAQNYLLNFYKKLGFIEISEVYLLDDIPHIKMVLKNSLI